MHKYKVTEFFYSVQGEGFWAGTPMFFVRLSQCPVGKVKGICTSWDGTRFICDTGQSYYKNRQVPRHATVEWHHYNEVNHELTAKEIWELCISHDACARLLLTGGEPLIHHLDELAALTPFGGQIHIETSGTEEAQARLLARKGFWVAVSPKEGCTDTMISLADEVKLLVAHTTTIEQLEQWYSKYSCLLSNKVQVFLQPIEDIHWVSARQRALELTLMKPDRYRLSVQVHKMLNVR